ncbi:DUF1376 domain-containing protein [Shinella sp.]|uniref:DUF1376 domain-containing protein n=1 Tax=Shinella sp. TaxID=1870904 RepID=UPI00301C9431
MSDSIDVRHLPYMPLVIERLRKSRAWLRCRRQPELGFYLMNLWMAAYHQVPAGSLEDDDDVLADAAMCDPSKWDSIKSEVLTGWERRDNRVWHNVVTEIATDAVTKTRLNKKRTEAARLARAQALAAKNGGEFASEGSVTEIATDAVTEPVTGAVTASVTDDEGRSKKVEVSKKEKEPPVGGSKKRAFRLPDDWQPDHSFGEAEGFSTAEINREADKFRDYWRQQPGQKGVKLDWTAAWRNWIRKAADDRKARKGAGSRSAPRADDDLTNDFLFGGRR